MEQQGWQVAARRGRGGGCAGTLAGLKRGLGGNLGGVGRGRGRGRVGCVNAVLSVWRGEKVVVLRQAWGVWACVCVRLLLVMHLPLSIRLATARAVSKLGLALPTYRCRMQCCVHVQGRYHNGRFARWHANKAVHTGSGTTPRETTGLAVSLCAQPLHQPLCAHNMLKASTITPMPITRSILSPLPPHPSSAYSSMSCPQANHLPIR